MKTRKNHRTRTKQIFSALLAMLLLFGSVGSWSAYAQAAQERGNEPTISVAPAVEELELPAIIDVEEAIENGYTRRVKAEEHDLYTFVFAGSDGQNTMRVFSHPVKYVAEDGSIRDITLDIQAKSGGGFITADHAVVTTFAGNWPTASAWNTRMWTFGWCLRRPPVAALP